MNFNNITPLKGIFITMGMAFLGLLLAVIITASNIQKEPVTPKALSSYSNQLPLLDSTLNAFIHNDSISKEVVTLIEKSDFNKKNKSYTNILFFNLHPRFALWLTSFSILICFSFAFVPVVISIIHNLKIQFGITTKAMFGFSIFAFFFVIIAGIFSLGMELQLFSGEELLLSYGTAMEAFGLLLQNPARTLIILILLAGLSSMFAICGVLCVAYGLNKLHSMEKSGKESFNDFYKKFKFAGDMLNRLLLVLAITISGTVITSSFLSESIMESLPKSLHYLFPVEFVYLYGLTYTIFLVIAYAPIYFQLRNIGYESLENPNLLEIENEEVKSALTNTLKLKTGSINTLQIILSLAAPALTGILSQFLG